MFPSTASMLSSTFSNSLADDFDDFNDFNDFNDFDDFDDFDEFDDSEFLFFLMEVKVTEWVGGNSSIDPVSKMSGRGSADLMYVVRCNSAERNKIRILFR